MTVAGLLFIAAWSALGIGAGFWVVFYCIREPRGQHAGAGEGAWNASTLTGLDQQRRPAEITTDIGHLAKETPLFGFDVLSGYATADTEEITGLPVWVAPEDLARLSEGDADSEATATFPRTLVGAAA